MLNVDIGEDMKRAAAMTSLDTQAFVFAQNGGLSDFLLPVMDLLNIGVAIIIGLTILYILYGGIQLIWFAGDDKGRVAARRTLVWGIIALACSIAVFGIVRIIKGTFFP